MHGFLEIFKIMGPLLVLMLCPIWLPLLGMLIGKLSDVFSGGGKRVEPAHRMVRAEPAEAGSRVSR
ncbi:hypothetical protein G3I59_06000 [Amycolatopsis rubida]|uniref:Uncharacterized protein n=1 Tax=Amycolatopsis rubida TaxID=112413 RepID=A0A1I5JE15_9PSEU|nr:MULTISPECIES: hypothetical protein [Amycolatopsis]MYW90183.1 hypothetical protein [Amycolatopsis rubida]NEC55160.1 hypothetical protein [Amycolatopsis rubida]OAP28554.1 hypothetical protein A4R44_00344 [Amycolatopsis sp. M39]SFO70823.1 hypothetical protein SAMN05421854_1021075 [Amycolatopsis rubida]